MALDSQTIPDGPIWTREPETNRTLDLGEASGHFLDHFLVIFGVIFWTTFWSLFGPLLGAILGLMALE